MEATVFVSTTKTYMFKAKSSEMKPYPLCLGNISKGFAVNNIKSMVKWIRVRFFC